MSNTASSTTNPPRTSSASGTAGLAGWGLLAVLERTTSQPRLIWTVAAPAVCAISMLGPLTSGADAASSGTLVAIHLVVAAVLVPVFAATARR